MKLTYNYCCISGKCDIHKTLHIEGYEQDTPICTHCKQPLKRIGICTSILHKGTQEALNKMKR